MCLAYESKIWTDLQIWAIITGLDLFYLYNNWGGFNLRSHEIANEYRQSMDGQADFHLFHFKWDKESDVFLIEGETGSEFRFNLDNKQIVTYILPN